MRNWTVPLPKLDSFFGVELPRKETNTRLIFITEGQQGSVKGNTPRWKGEERFLPKREVSSHFGKLIILFIKLSHLTCQKQLSGQLFV